MTLYFYKATDQTGKFCEGNVEAPDYSKAVQSVRNLNYFPIEVTAKSPGIKFNMPRTSLNLKKEESIPARELMDITQQLSTLLDSGFTIDKSLGVLAQLAQRPQSRVILTALKDKVHAGSSLADALAEYPQIFSKLYVNMIRAGEAGGTLGPSLMRLSGFLESSEELKASILSAMIYPVVLILFGGAALTVLITVVIPQLSQLFEDMGDALPLITQLMLAISSFLRSYWWTIFIGMVVTIIAFYLFIKTPAGRLKWDGFLLNLPVIGPLIRKIEISRFSRTLSTLLQSGVPVLAALTIVASILGNRVIGEAMHVIHKGLKSGRGLSTPLQETGVFPPLAVHMITIGEQSGNLDEMLEKVSATYDKEVERSIKQLVSMIAPLMILIMAVVIGFIVISMLVGIFSVNDVTF
ncbi:MAG: type II secretion system protein GspF [Nitrospinae bacterium CG11_big_fil_rev_8_21_14_0_20_45_15]|nr:MAG: type II secretion system protein GspF [Nitrospinae bacterium CG11_big_fil_rev_8_21_14_0_20_45_15]